jgi:hypothetical protein
MSEYCYHLKHIEKYIWEKRPRRIIKDENNIIRKE